MKQKQQRNNLGISLKKSLVKSITLGCLLAGSAKADQPVHCLRESLFGVWDFHVSKDVENVNLFNSRELCTHSIPNKVQVVNKLHQFKFENEDIYRFNLMDNYKAEAVICKDGKDCDKTAIKGKWTSIYDQAFNIELENGMRFIANFRYNIKPIISHDPFHEAITNGIGKFSNIESGDYDKFDSQCADTMVGFVQPTKTGEKSTMAEHRAVCFYGVQKKHYDIEETKAFNTGKMKYNKIVAHHEVKPVNLASEEAPAASEQETKPPKKVHAAFKRGKAKKRVNMHLEHKPSDEMDLMITAVNEADLGWTADVCKYQKSHALYGSHCDNEKLILAQVSDEAEDEASAKKEFGVAGDKDFESSLTQAQQYMKKYGSADQIPDSELPETHDWRDVNGYDFTSNFRDQGHCGSCYTISFTQVAEARLKVKYGKNPPAVSPQFMMTCNYMNEGCDGGWPHFNVFLAENGHMVSEDCAPYQGQTKGDKCKNYEQCPPVAKVAHSYLVGGGWGATSEKKMMKEILRNGPINGDFQAPSMFSIYKEGIFSEQGLVHLHQSQSEKLAQQLLDLEKGLETEDETNLQTDFQQSESSDKKKVDQKYSDTTLNDKGISWMDMNHSVVIVGWGKDPKTDTRYWIVRNSYGKKWGMNGDFLVKRGNNDFGMEVEQIAFEPTLCQEGQGAGACQEIEQS